MWGEVWSPSRSELLPPSCSKVALQPETVGLARGGPTAIARGWQRIPKGGRRGESRATRAQGVGWAFSGRGNQTLIGG